MSEDLEVVDPAPTEEEKPPTGHCTKCGAIVPLADTTPAADGLRFHRVGPRGHIGKRELGEPCGPVAERYVYHVVAHYRLPGDSLSVIRTLMSAPVPVERAYGRVLAMWEQAIARGFKQTDEANRLILGGPSPTVVVTDYKLLAIE